MLDVAFDAVGLKSTFEQALELPHGRRPSGRRRDERRGAERWTHRECSHLTQKHVLGHLGYQNVDIGTLATLVSRGRLDLSRSISDVVSLEDVASSASRRWTRHDGNPIRILVQP